MSALGLLARYGLSQPGSSPPPPPGAYRYYRLYVTANNGGFYTETREFELRAYRGGPTLPLTAGGNAISSGGSTPEDAFDGSYADGSFWSTAPSSDLPAYVGWDFGAPVYVGQFAIGAANSSSGGYNRSIKDALIQGSNDGSAWDTLIGIESQTGWAATDERVFTRDGCPGAPAGTPHRFYRLTVTANNGGGLIGISELGVYASGGSNQLAVAGTSAQGHFGTNLANLVDGDTRTGLQATPGTPQNITIRLPTRPAAPATEYRVGAHFTTTDTAARSARDWSVERSHDGLAWDTWDTVTGESGWVVDEVRTFTP